MSTFFCGFLTISEIRIPGSLLLIAYFCCKIPLGVAHSPRTWKELMNDLFGAAGQQAEEGGTPPASPNGTATMVFVSLPAGPQRGAG